MKRFRKQKLSCLITVAFCPYHLGNSQGHTGIDVDSTVILPVTLLPILRHAAPVGRDAFKASPINLIAAVTAPVAVIGMARRSASAG